MIEHLDRINRLPGANGNESLKEENANFLRQITGDGEDQTKPRRIDSHQLLAREEDAVADQGAARNQGYPADHDFWAELGAWLTTVRVRMVRPPEEITAGELALDGTARSFVGKPDGWGSMKVDVTPPR